MRFQTPQTTPSYLDRRLQRRMLSFVALISVMMVGLSFLQTRTTSPTQRSGVSPDELTYEVVDERRPLKPGEVLIGGTADDGIRGQSPSTDADLSADELVALDDDLFQSRRRERTEGGQFFSRRTAGQPASKSLAGDDFDSGPSTPVHPVRRPTNMSDFDTSSRAAEQPQTPEFADSNSLRHNPPRGNAPQTNSESSSEWIPTPRGTSQPTIPDEDWMEPQRDIPPAENPLNVDAPAFSRNRSDLFGESDGTPSSRGRSRPIDAPKRVPARDSDQFADDSIAPERPRSRQPEPLPPRNPADGDAGAATNEPWPNAMGRDRAVPIDTPRDLRRREAEPASISRPSVRIDRRFLDLVKDNTLGVRSDEAEVFYWLVGRAREVTAGVLDRAGVNDVQYVNLMTEPDRYRGEPITIEGDLWRLYEMDAGSNDYDVHHMYEGWVFTGDSGNHPYRIVCSRLAKGIEPGENLRIPVRLTGYFFKKESYRSNGGVHVAPTLIADKIEINTAPNGIPMTSGIVPYMLTVILAIAMALMVTIVAFAIGDERSNRAKTESRNRHSISFDNLNVPPTVPVEELLREFAEQEREAAVTGAYGPLLSRQTAREHAVHDAAMSRQLQHDAERQKHLQQTSAIHDWAEKQAVGGTAIPPKHDELQSDKLDSARHPLPAGLVSVPDPTPATQIPPSGSKPAAVRTFGTVPTSPVPPVSPVAGPRPLHQPTSKPVEQSKSGPRAVPHQESAVSPSSAAGASKLSEWENEVARLANRPVQRPFQNAMGTVTRDVEHPAPEVDENQAGATFTLSRDVSQRLELERLEQEHHRRELKELERFEQELLAHERSATERHGPDHRAAS